MEVLRAKCEFKGISIPRLADLEPHRADLEAGWIHMLEHQLPALLPVRTFWDALPEIFNWLRGAVAQPLAAMPVGAGTTLIRERVVDLPAGSLAQQPGSHVVLKYVRPVVKRKDTLAIVTAAAPGQVLERTAADVSFLAGMLVDKFRYHLPLYRQHQRLGDHGIVVSRSSLNTWASRAIDLLEPIFQAQNANVLQSRVLAMDETSIKAGRKAKGKMRTGWFWPVYGDGDEIVFHFAPSREHRHVRSFLGEFRGTLLTDGYEGYAAYAGTRPGQVIHGQCWSHTRRGFERAKDGEPEAVAEALTLIGAMYRHEKQIRDDTLTGAAKREYRTVHIRPVVEAFWKWCRTSCERTDLLPKNPWPRR